MNEFLEKRWPMLVILALTVIAIAMANKLASHNLPGKGLQFRIINKIPIAAMAEHPSPGLQLLADDRPLEKVYLSTLVIKNTGNIPIRKDDYDTPIMVQVHNDPTIVQLRYELDPPDIHTEVSATAKKVTLTPSLLNPGDRVLIQLFTQGGLPDFDIGARIQGVKKIYTEEGAVESPWGELTSLDYFIFVLTLFNIMLFALVLQKSVGAKYVAMRQKTAVVLFVSLTIISLYTFFDMKISSTHVIYSSTFLLIGCTILAFLLAWRTARYTEGQDLLQEADE